ncbi:MAG: histidine phosphatase family protein [Streptosporangiales bacterium]|nr:histidine phosphatase family protein [Streptosporangiales bacterium]
MTARGRRVVLWRHGQTGWNVENRFQGHTDIPLTDVGVAQARQAAARLATLRPAAIVTSDLTRARETAGALAGLTGLDVAVDARLRERSGGSWEGLTQDEIQAKFPEAWALWQPTDGEDEVDVGERVAGAVHDAVERLAAGELLVVSSHGAAIRYGIGTLLGLEPGQWRRLGPLSNCAWSVMDETPTGWQPAGWRLLEHNAGSLPEPALSDDR